MHWDPAVAAIALPAERGSAWTLMYPQFSVVVPEPDIVKVPLAFPIAATRPGVRQLHQYLDRSQAEGRDARGAYDYWVLGEQQPAAARWSIIRNVLHWTGP